MPEAAVTGHRYLDLYILRIQQAREYRWTGRPLRFVVRLLDFCFLAKLVVVNRVVKVLLCAPFHQKLPEVHVQLLSSPFAIAS